MKNDEFLIWKRHICYTVDGRVEVSITYDSRIGFRFTERLVPYAWEDREPQEHCYTTSDYDRMYTFCCGVDAGLRSLSRGTATFAAMPGGAAGAVQKFMLGYLVRRGKWVTLQ